jgi:uncharacterized membrane protein YsdA (DUF1294 family)
MLTIGFPVIASAYLLAVNVIAAWAFARDKRASIVNGPRISEDRLLAIAFLGGSVGAKIAQKWLRHKTRKEPFRQQLNGIVSMQLLALAAVYFIHVVSGDVVVFAAP